MLLMLKDGSSKIMADLLDFILAKTLISQLVIIILTLMSQLTMKKTTCSENSPAKTLKFDNHNYFHEIKNFNLKNHLNNFIVESLPAVNTSKSLSLII